MAFSKSLVRRKLTVASKTFLMTLVLLGIGFGLFFYFWTQSQDQYYQERNIRQLGVMSRQIKTRIESYARSLRYFVRDSKIVYHLSQHESNSFLKLAGLSVRQTKGLEVRADNNERLVALTLGKDSVFLTPPRSRLSSKNSLPGDNIVLTVNPVEDSISF